MLDLGMATWRDSQNECATAGVVGARMQGAQRAMQKAMAKCMQEASSQVFYTTGTFPGYERVGDYEAFLLRVTPQ